MTRALVLATAAVLTLLAGCGGVQQKETISYEQSLEAAGFEKRPADTRAKLAALQKMPQQRLLTQDHNGQAVFLYADAADCQCLYAGSQAASDRFHKQVAKQDVADEGLDAQSAMPLSTDPDWLNVDAFGDGDGAPWW